MYRAAEKAGIETAYLGSRRHNLQRDRHSLERNRTKNERIRGYGAIKLRPRRRSRGMEPIDKAGEQCGLLACAKQRALELRCAQIVKVNLELSRARLLRSLLRNTASREGQVTGSLQRAIGEVHRVPTEIAVLDMKRGVIDDNVARQI